MRSFHLDHRWILIQLGVRVHVLLQVHIQELKNQVQLAILVHHILQTAGGVWGAGRAGIVSGCNVWQPAAGLLHEVRTEPVGKANAVGCDKARSRGSYAEIPAAGVQRNEQGTTGTGAARHSQGQKQNQTAAVKPGASPHNVFVVQLFEQ